MTHATSIQNFSMPDEHLLVDAKDIAWRYGDSNHAFELRVDELTVRAGQSVACTAVSGSGKSTLLQILAGILWPAEGQLRVCGFDLSKQASTPASDRARRAFRVRHLGLVFQEFELLDHLTVEENILLPYLIHSVHRSDSHVRERVVRLANRTGIKDHLSRMPRRLSQGERQRVAVCRALVTEPSLILADEPTGNLDPDTTRVVLDLLQHDVHERGAGLLMVTHDHSLLGQFDTSVTLGVTAEATS